MELNYFKDKLFDLLNNNSDELNISDIETHEKENIYEIFSTNGDVYEILFRYQGDKKQ